MDPLSSRSEGKQLSKESTVSVNNIIGTAKTCYRSVLWRPSTQCVHVHSTNRFCFWGTSVLDKGSSHCWHLTHVCSHHTTGDTRYSILSIFYRVFTALCAYSVCIFCVHILCNTLRSMHFSAVSFPGPHRFRLHEEHISFLTWVTSVVERT